MADPMLLVGRQFGRLTVTGPVGRRDGQTAISCACSCGAVGLFVPSVLTRGSATSCGCGKIERARSLHKMRTSPPRIKHGHARRKVRHPLYATWVGMKQRCFDPRHQDFAIYGGRGITVCFQWKESFENFLSDMGPKPSLRHSIDRINTDGNYEPGNCRWASSAEQMRNVRTNRLITIGAETLTLAEWSVRSGLGHKTISYRIGKGWPASRAVFDPPRCGTPLERREQ